MAEAVPRPTPVFHITQLGNLAGIIRDGCLYCTNDLDARGRDYLTSAHPHIQARRERHAVSVGPGGTLHDYVPFQFAPRSPMLFTISRGNVPTCTDQKQMVHLVGFAQEFVTACDCVFTDGHADMALTNYYADLADLDKINWGVMRSKYWNDTTEYPDRKRQRQAEFLVHRSAPWTLIRRIGVCTSTIAQEVEQLFKGVSPCPVVSVHRDWYY